jgi:hypothetical protein
MPNNGLVYLKEVTKYFMDFLETDFHKRKNPKRTIKLRNEDNLLVGIKLDKYPSFNDAIWKSIRDAFGSRALKQISKSSYKSNISANLIGLNKYLLKNVNVDKTNELAEKIAKIVENYAFKYKDEFDKALSNSLEDAAEVIRKVLVSPFIGSISKSLQSAGIGDENSIYLMEEELTAIFAKGLENKVSDITKQLIAGDSLETVEEIKSVLEFEEIKINMMSFFESYEVTDLYNEIFEIARNKNILETQELYLYFCDITFTGSKYPIFYIPVNFQRQGDTFSIEFDAHVYVNKKALEFIVQEYRNKTGTIGDLKTVKERIIYLANNGADFKAVIGEILSEIVGFFELDVININLTDSSAQTAKSMHLRISNACYISLFDKSDEAVVNDYEEILRLLNEENSELAKAFQKIIEDFIHNDPESHISHVEGEWDGLETSEKLVFEAPIPLNEEQRQILMAIKRPGCNYVTVGGPPGTGKSHTITAIVCDCVLNNKTVLVLSDKKEALDVVENKISDALNKVRNDKNFQNPILRLGKTGTTYARILAPAIIKKIKTHYRAVRNNSTKESIQNNLNNLAMLAIIMHGE